MLNWAGNDESKQKAMMSCKSAMFEHSSET